MALYSFRGAYPAQLPNRIKLPNGFTKTDKSTFTDEDINDAGFFAVDNPPEVPYPNKLGWNGTEWFIREPNTAETAFKWQTIKNECEKRLLDTDYKVIKAMETGIPLDTAYVEYRQVLRDLYNNTNGVDPWTVAYPLLQIEEIEEIEELPVSEELIE